MEKRPKNSSGETDLPELMSSNKGSVTRLAHLTDTHIAPYGKRTAVLKDLSVDIVQNLIAQLNDRGVDTVLFGGDNIDNREAGAQDLQAFLGLVKPLLRWYCILGNHEAQSGILGSGQITQNDFLKAVDGHGIGPNKTSFSEAVGNVRIVGINTTFLDYDGGFVCDETFSFLVEELKASTEDHIVILGHHLLTRPWAPDRMDVWDQEYLVKNRDRVNSLLSSHPRVRAYLCGHHHASRIDRIVGRGGQGGFYHILTPSSAAFPHGARVLSFEDEAILVETIEPRLDGIMEDGMSAVLGGRKARRFAALGRSDSFLDYVGGRDCDKHARLPHRLQSSPRLETTWRAERQDAT